MSVEDDLLLGLLAVRNEMLSESALIEAVTEWAADKSEPLGERIVRADRLSPADADFLAPLARRFAERRGGGAAEAVGSLSSLGSLANKLRDVGDTQIEGTLPPPEPPATLSPTDPAATATRVPPPPRRADPDATHVPSGSGVEVELPAGASRYRVLKPHAEGGLGKVSVAEDLELHRSVALKEIKGRFADDPAARGRFLLEAEVTGGLEHPGIVPVYGLGRDEGGRPYYAMRFVRGDTLKDAADAFHAGGRGFDSVAFRKLLGRFVDVCQAVAYAHSRGVLHRDLKPGNVMLGKYGETLVVDWGLAKVAGKAEIESGEPTLHLSSGSGSVETQAGQAVGTPAYMPPEQAAGRLEEVGPWSDVYSLGATLYYLLCGRPPVQGNDLASLLKQVESGDVAPPRSVREDVPKPLAAVCVKALSRRPGGRYAGCGELAEECERWLADEPVAAARDPWAVRARRWARKHPAVVASTAAVLLVTVLGSMAFSSVLAGKNEELTAANAAERIARGKAQSALETAEANEKTAHEQSELALATLTGVVMDVQTELRDLPRGGAVRRRLLNRSLAGFENLAGELLTSGAADRTRMHTLHELSTVLLEIGGGGPAPASGESVGGSGDTPGGRSAVRLAVRFAEEGLRIAESLAAADPGSEDARRQQSVSLLILGDARSAAGDTAAALGLFERSLKISASLAAVNPDSAVAWRDLSVSLGRVGDARHAGGDTAAALISYERLLEIAESLSAANPESGAARRDLLIALDRVGDGRAAAGDTAGALASYERSLAIAESLAAAEPDSVAARGYLSFALDSVAGGRASTGDKAGALALYGRSLKIRESLAAADPENPAAYRGVSLSVERIGDLLLETGRTTEAGEMFDRTLSMKEALLAADPDSAVSRRDLSVALSHVGDVRVARGDKAGALALYGRSLEIRESLAAADPGSAANRRALAVALDKVGDVRLATGDEAAALTLYGRSLEIFESLAAADPDNAVARRDLSGALDNVGGTRLAAGNAAGAMELFERSLDIRESMAAAEPESLTALRNVSLSVERIGGVLLQTNRVADAGEMFDRMLSMKETLLAADPDSVVARRDLSVALKRVGGVRLATGDTAGALVVFRRSLEIDESLVEADPEDLTAYRDVSLSVERIGSVLLRTGRIADAREMFARMLGMKEELVAADPGNATARRDVCVALFKLGELEQSRGDDGAAIKRFREGLAAVEAAEREGVTWPDSGVFASGFRQWIVRCEARTSALGDWDSLLAMPVEKLPAALRTRAISFSDNGRIAEAAQAAAKLRTLDNATTSHLFQAASVFGRCAASIDPANDQSTERLMRQREEWIDAGLEALVEAFARRVGDAG